MQNEKISPMSIIKQVQARRQQAQATNDGAAVRVAPPIVSNYPDELKNEPITYPENPYYNDSREERSFLTFNPLTEFERHQQAVFRFISDPKCIEDFTIPKVARLFDFDHWLEVNSRHDADFGSSTRYGVSDLRKNVITSLNNLWKRYAATVKETDQNQKTPSVASDSGESVVTTSGAAQGFVPKNGIPAPQSIAERLFTERLHSLYFYLWYTTLGLHVDRINEVEHFIELMECACCPIQMENVSFCVSLLAGHQAEDRETFLARLRPHFQNHLARVQGKAITCHCGEGLS